MDRSGNEWLRVLVDELNKSGGIYHKMDLGAGLVVRGEYDMAKYISHYGIPEQLNGQSVLDIGTAKGFFALECARRGATVTAIDIWDGGLLEKFQEALDLRFTYRKTNLYSLDEAFGQFDLVLCCSLLLHLSDIFGAICKLRMVCKGCAIVSTALLDDPERSVKGYCEFLGLEVSNGEHKYGTYWSVNVTALKRMLLCAGFSEVREISRFSLNSEPGGHGFCTPHVVMHALVDFPAR